MLQRGASPVELRRKYHVQFEEGMRVVGVCFCDGWGASPPFATFTELTGVTESR